MIYQIMSKRVFSRLFVLNLLCVAYFWYSKWIPFQTDTTVGPQNLTILIWDWPRMKSRNLVGDECWNRHHISGCYLTGNHVLFPKADVVVFHNAKLQSGVKLPLNFTRPPAQRWVWASMESPANNGNLSRFDDLFNWTMTYRRDADVHVPYGRLSPKTQKSIFSIPKKRKLVCWVVSKNKPHYKRTAVYNNLSHLIPVEVYGKLTKKTLGDDQLLSTVAQHYFYLAFENSEFKDYITEKLWRNAFKAGSVPVVWGPSRQNYEAFVPADSFIHVNDFRSVKELAKFLRSLAGDRTRYESYFRWHQDYSLKSSADYVKGFCQICQKFYELPKKVYHSLDAWQRGEGAK